MCFDIKTTISYLQPTNEDIMMNMNRYINLYV